jgi:hypothetical protein
MLLSVTVSVPSFSGCFGGHCPATTMDGFLLLEPQNGDQIAGPDVDIRIALPIGFSPSTERSVCVAFVHVSAGIPQCVTSLGDGETFVDAKLTVAPGRHTIAVWIGTPDGSTGTDTTRTAQFDTLPVERPWWGPYRRLDVNDSP